MIGIEVTKNVYTWWDPTKRVISMGTSTTPLDFAHEVAHARLGHDRVYLSNLSEFIEERDAWMLALRRLPPDEIKVTEIQDSLRSYSCYVEEAHGSNSPQYRMVEKMTDEVIEYAKKRKREV